jgi:hypothetical protein
MVRVVLILMALAALIWVAAGVVALVRALAPAMPGAPRRKEDLMPEILRNVAFVLLLLLLFGVATGWLGA